MDKLEKALQKARELRQIALAQAAPEPAAPEPPEAEPSPPKDPVELAAEALESHRIIARRSRESNADTFRILRTKIMQLMARSNLRTLAITSPQYGDGKTTVSINLAMSLALDVKQTVLLVDLDMRKPNVHEFLGLEPTVGLSDYLTGGAKVADCLIKPAIERLTVLPIIKPMDNSSEVLGTPKMAALAKELKARYSDRMVIYDMPPMLAQDDTIAFLPHVDGVLLVVRDGVTLIDDLKQCMHALEHTNLLGTVLNNCA